METITKKRKSVALTRDEWSALKKYRNTFLTDVECAEAVGIERGPIARIILIGRGSTESIDKIREVLKRPDQGDRNIQDNTRI